MSDARLEKIDAAIEKRILTGMIVSDSFLQRTRHMIRPEYFKSRYTKILAEWCLSFFDTHAKAPLHHIEDIYNFARKRMTEEEEKLIAYLLQDISNRYDAGGEQLNVPYLADQTEDFCISAGLDELIAAIVLLKQSGHIRDAQALIMNYHQVAKTTSKWFNPFDPEEIYSHFREMDLDFFKFPGHLGEFLKNFERGWLVGISAPFKRGKTWFAQEFGIVAVLASLKVAFISLEMSKGKTKERVYKRLTATSGAEGIFIYPCFDCRFNQTGNCDIPQRTNQIPLVENEEDPLPEFDPTSGYKVCTFCRNHRQFGDNYEAAIWYEPISRPEHTSELVTERAKSLVEIYGDNFRCMAYPRFSANVNDLKRDLDLLEQMEGFIPDVIIVDYADILKPESAALSGVEKEDRTWIALSQLAGERHALVITPTQLTKDALDAHQIKQKHTARWVGKLGHVDAMLSLSQTEQEKLAGIMRIGMMLHRHEDFSESDTCTILQLLTLGQFSLDSQRTPRRD